ncbi:MAG TPA: TonB-dependent receptor, partial [Verrucomicrobiae bacterium]|nr:TonB-dependent receptor [Verrucomicrobiae bacterium]
ELNAEGQFKKAIRTAFLTGLAAALTSPAAMAQEAGTADKDKDATELETMEVTGSRLGRADIEGALPVATITRADIETSGFTSVAELLRNTTFNSLGAFRAQSGSSAQGLVTVDLRGLGSERTLVLIDGRRAPKAPFSPSAQDLNAVPLAAVERIEVLKDGASAIYGSDAIAGVINIITRKDYTGASLSYQEQTTDRVGGDSHGGQFMSGISSEKGSLVFGASFFSRDIIFARDSLFNTPGASFFSNNYYLSGFVDANSDYIDDNTGHPYYGAVSGGCPNSDPAFFTYANQIGGINCGYNFNLVAADEAETGNKGVFARTSYKITDDWTMNMAGSVSRATSFGRYAPSLNDVAIVVPAGSPNNPFADQDIYLYHRFAGLGTRDNDTDANVYDLSGSFEGTFGDFTVTTGSRYNEYQFYELGKNYVVLPIASQYIIDGTYDIYDPSVNNPSSVLNAMKATINRASYWKTLEYYAEGTMPLFPMPGGSARLAVGAEYRTEKYFDQYDSLSEGGAIGGSSGNSSGTNRKVKAGFAEMLLPIVDIWEVSLSGRYEDYNDVGENFAPKISTRVQPVDRFTLRASAGTGFRAPSLDIISALPAFSAEPLRNDAQTCAAVGGTFNAATFNCSRSTQVSTTIISNPNLQAEDSTQYGLGFAVDITDALDVSLDYYNISIEDAISYLSPSQLVDLLNRGRPLPAGFSITRALTGKITGAVAGYANQGEFNTSGLDLAVNLGQELGAAGRISSNLNFVYILEYTYDVTGVEIDPLGEPATPQYRATLHNTYSLGGLAVALNANHIAKQNENTAAGGEVPSYTTWDAQIGYELPFLGGTQLAVGAINLFGREPSPNSAFDGRDYNFYLYDQYGTQPYFKLVQKF